MPPTIARSFCARGDGGVARLARVQLRVVEVDHDLAPGEPAAAFLRVQVRGAGLRAVDRALEQARRQRVVDVGHHGDVDLRGGDPDLRRLGLLVARLRARRHDADQRRRHHERADQGASGHSLHGPPHVLAAEGGPSGRSASEVRPHRMDSPRYLSNVCRTGGSPSACSMAVLRGRSGPARRRCRHRRPRRTGPAPRQRSRGLGWVSGVAGPTVPRPM